jgi:hypothetical protein
MIAEELGIKTIPRITVGRLSRDEEEDYRLNSSPSKGK